MKRVLFSIAAVLSLFSAGCCCDLFNCCNPCGRSCCSSPCGSPCGGSPCGGSPCSNGACGTPTGYLAPVNGTAYAPGSGVPLTANAGMVNGPIVQTAATMPLDALPTY